MSSLALLRTPQVARLLFSSLLGRFPLGMVPLALVLFARAGGADYGFAGWLTASYSIGACVGGPVLSRLMDLRGQRGIVVSSGLICSLALASTPWTTPTVALVLAAVGGLATPPLEPALRTLWAGLLPADDVKRAFALEAAAQELVFVLGPLVVLVAESIAEGWGLVAAAVLCLLGALWFAAAPASRRWRPHDGAERHWLGPLRSRRLVVLYGTCLMSGVTIGVLAVAAVAYAEHSGRLEMGAWLVAANALGALAGGVAYSGVAPRRDPDLDVLLSAAALGAAYLALGVAPGGQLGLMAVVCVLSGAPLPPLLTCLFQLVDRLAPVGTTSEAFAWLVSAFLAGIAAGGAAAGLLAEAGHVGGAFAVGAVTAWLGLVVAWFVVRPGVRSSVP